MALRGGMMRRALKFFSVVLLIWLCVMHAAGQGAQPSKPAPRAIDLSGIWWILQTFPGGHHYIQASFHQKDGSVRTCLIVPSPTAPGKFKYVESGMCWSGTYDGVQKSFSVKAEFPLDPKLDNTDIIYIDDQNHVHNKVGGGIPVVRGSNTLECKFDKDTKMTMEYGFVRALTAIADLNNYSEATCWLNGLSEAGDVQAQVLLASILYQGADGVAKDPQKSFYWAEKAASKGDYLAALLLAHCYKEGFGTAPDTQKSNYWLGMSNEWRVTKFINESGDKPTPWGLTPKELFLGSMKLIQSIDDNLGYCSRNPGDPVCPEKFRHPDYDSWINPD